MLCIHLKNPDPYYCLAAEEYLLKNFTDDIFMLWQSNKTVVVGKHQNAMGEIDYRFVSENNIRVARRISGGGTVYHDAGNVNFTFIKNVKSPAEISFKQFTEPVVEALAMLGVEASTSGRNDLLVQGLKISGNAEHVFKNRVLHHGTLLFNSNLQQLGNAIRVSPGKYLGKAVQSNRSTVGNISSFLLKSISVSEFIKFLLNVQLSKSNTSEYVLNATDEEAITTLFTDKFCTWKWNYGYSPKYSFTNRVEVDGKSLSMKLEVHKGIIKECSITGTHFTTEKALQLNSEFIGKQHCFSHVKKVLQSHDANLIYSFF